MKRKDILSWFNILPPDTRYFYTVMIIMCSLSSFGQLNLNFNSGNINEIKWEGNINNFRINTQGQLQLNAPAAGESAIFTKFKVPADSIQIDLYFKLQFAPSNDNFSKIYLFTDNVSESQASGYYLRLGENGNNDAIQLWKLTKGNAVLLGSGRMGAISSDPADARVRFKIYRNGLWQMATDYDGNVIFEDDLEIMDSALNLPDSLYFGIYCKYTATRTDKFFYDDIIFKTIERDTTPPSVVLTEAIDKNTIKLTFSESLDESSATNKNAYSADQNLGSPDQVIFTASAPTVVTLIYSQKNILSGKLYTLTIDGVKDRSNNILKSKVNFSLLVKPEKGDLILTEVLTDPFSGGEDFIEVYNNSDKFLKLDSLTVSNRQKNENRIIRTDFILYPKKYVAISRNTDFLRSTYFTPDTANFIAATLPSLNVDGANITLISTLGSSQIVLDSFDYSQKYHFDLIDNPKGVSLERIHLQGITNDKNNWHSASQQVKYATPGYKNSNNIDPSTMPNDGTGIFPDKKVISPDGDGLDDFVLLNYVMNKPGFLATIRVFDAEGIPQFDLTNNFLMGTEGSIKWDGIDGEGKIMKTGMYILYSRLFHPDGDIREFKQVVVVAHRF